MFALADAQCRYCRGGGVVFTSFRSYECVSPSVCKHRVSCYCCVGYQFVWCAVPSRAWHLFLHRERCFIVSRVLFFV